MATLTSLPSPKKHSPKNGTTPRKNYRHDAFGETPSSTPTSPSRRTKSSKNTQRDLPRSQMTNFGTYLEDYPPVQHHDEAEDPHDLTYPSNMNPRASMVDNLVLSLDQFSNPTSTAAVPTSNRKERDGATRRKGRGHTFSSSVSSEGDVREMMALPSFAVTAPRVPRRNSLKHQRNLDKLPSIFAEDEDSVRSRVYDAQRAEVPAKRKPGRQPAQEPRSRSSSTSSELDLSHLAKFQGRLGPAGVRRSRSFDFGASQREQRRPDVREPIAINVTPVPDPVAQNISITPSYTEPSLGRRNSTKSSKSIHGRKPRAGTLGAANGKPKNIELPPPLPITKSAMNLTYNGGESKSGQNSPHDTNFAVRPGFFRRVFGSSKNVHLQVDTLSAGNTVSTRLSQDPADRHETEPSYPATPPTKPSKPARRPSLENVANKENFQTVAKKSSAFFRRRKKSNTNIVAPPMPLTLTSDVKPENLIGEASPVSSLRAFMDPYLADNTIPAAPHTGDSSKQSFHTPPLGPPPVFGPLKASSARTETIRHVRSVSKESTTTLQRASKPAVLQNTQQETFLADSSSSEEQPRRDPPKFETKSRNITKLPQNAHRALSPSDRDVAASNNPGLQLPERSDSRISIKDGRNTPRAGASLATKPTRPGQHEPVKPYGSKTVLTVDTSHKDSTASATAPNSDGSEYKSALDTPALLHPAGTASKGPQLHISHPSMSVGDVDGDKLKARRIFDNIDEEHDQSVAGAWLGEAGTERERIRKFYMELFDFAHLNILSSLRSLCDRIVLRGETQQMDRMIDAFARRWCECNSSHGFISSDVVHTICFSILLLNTDLHLADIGQKMTKTQFVRNALPPIRGIAQDSGEVDISGTRSPAFNNIDNAVDQEDNNTTLRTARRPTDRMTREDSTEPDVFPANGGPLIETPYTGSEKAWESQIEAVLKGFYNSIAQEPLPLFGSPPDAAVPQQNNNFLTLGTNMLRRTPSTLSKAQSDTHRGRFGSETRTMGARWVQKARSRPRLPSAPGFGSSRTSIDDQSSAWSPSMSSTWSKNSFGRTIASMSVDSFGTEAGTADYQQSIGFANALSQAIIRDDQSDLPIDDAMKQAPLLEDESLELCGAPWAKEGILKHKCHLEGVDKRSKDRNWNDCFAVIEKGYMRLFSFSVTAKSLRTKARNQRTGAVVGGGNWQDNAEEVWKFVLRHAIASALPPPGYSKTRPYVWALSLPTGAVHLFSVGTPDIVKEFVSSANYWSARLSKEPMMGGVSNMEYGWSDQVINRALLAPESRSTLNPNAGSPRPSTQLSMRSSIDHAGSVRPRLPADRIHIKEWNPPQQSMFPSQLMEVDQFKALQIYVKNVEEDLQKHNELRGPMLLAFSSKHPNSAKALGNWEKKSSYLLREIVKFKTYIDILQSAQGTKEKIYKMRREEDESRRAEDDSRALTVD